MKSWEEETDEGTFVYGDPNRLPTEEGRYSVLRYPYTHGSMTAPAFMKYENGTRKW